MATGFRQASSRRGRLNRILRFLHFLAARTPVSSIGSGVNPFAKDLVEASGGLQMLAKFQKDGINQFQALVDLTN